MFFKCKKKKRTTRDNKFSHLIGVYMYLKSSVKNKITGNNFFVSCVLHNKQKTFSNQRYLYYKYRGEWGTFIYKCEKPQEMINYQTVFFDIFQ